MEKSNDSELVYKTIRRSHHRKKPNSNEEIYVKATKRFVKDNYKSKFSKQLKKDINNLLKPAFNELGYSGKVYELSKDEMINLTDEMVKKSKNPRKVFGMCLALQNINKYKPDKEQVVESYKTCSVHVSDLFKGTGFLGRGKKKLLSKKDIDVIF